MYPGKGLPRGGDNEIQSIPQRRLAIVVRGVCNKEVVPQLADECRVHHCGFNGFGSPA
jgi:hypothetical protein